MPHPRVGIIGAGQLGRMMALAGYPLGISCHLLDAHREAPGGQVAPLSVAALDDETALRELAAAVDVMTFDIENVSVPALRAIETIVPVMPGPEIVALGQDRLAEKQLFASLGIPTAPYVPIDSADDLARAQTDLGVPIVLKRRRLGYDGRGQRIVRAPGQLVRAWEELDGAPAIAEGWVEFETEVSLIGARNGRQETRFYALSENRHRDGMLESTIAPFAKPSLQARAEAWMTAMLERFDYRGVLTIEFFVTDAGLVANEIAPRVHNSGHWTIEGAETSQFENHLRAILDLPLGSTAMRGVAAMQNLVGRMPPREQLLSLEGLHLHDYGKTARPGRKLGHCTLLAPDRATAVARLEALGPLLQTSAT